MAAVSCEAFELTASFEKADIFFARNARGLQVITNDEDRDFLVGRNYDRSGDAIFDIRAMTACLSFEAEARRGEKQIRAFSNRRVKTWASTGQAPTVATAFESNPRGAVPVTHLIFVTRVLQHLVERAVIGRCAEKQAYRFVESLPGLFGRRAGAGYVQWHGVRDKLIAFLPNLNVVLDFHGCNLVQGHNTTQHLSVAV